MRQRHPLFLTMLVAVASLGLAACGARDKAEAEAREGFSGLADKAATELRDELATENLQVGEGIDGLPRAEISPQGELIIGGEKVALDANQQALALQYRKNLAGVAEAGVEVGLEGAALAGDALAAAAKGAFGGDTAEAEKRINAEAEGVRASARRLCDLLPALHASEQALKAAVPEFAPYADMDEADITDCHAEVAKS